MRLNIPALNWAVKSANRSICSNKCLENGIGQAAILALHTRGPRLHAHQGRITQDFQFGKNFKSKILDRQHWKNDRALGHVDIYFTDESKKDKSMG